MKNADSLPKYLSLFGDKKWRKWYMVVMKWKLQFCHNWLNNCLNCNVFTRVWKLNTEIFLNLKWKSSPIKPLRHLKKTHLPTKPKQRNISFVFLPLRVFAMNANHWETRVNTARKVVRLSKQNTQQRQWHLSLNNHLPTIRHCLRNWQWVSTNSSSRVTWYNGRWHALHWQAWMYF